VVRVVVMRCRHAVTRICHFEATARWLLWPYSFVST
jgi:hypothetical protein